MSYNSPVGKSDHLMITCRPVSDPPLPINIHFVRILDLRESHISSLVAAAAKVEWAKHVARLCSDLDLIDLVNQPTRGTNILDHILISRQLRDMYNSSSMSYNSPLGKSDHLMITCRPVSAPPLPINIHFVRILDLRESHISSLMAAAAKVEWAKHVAAQPDADSQWRAFHTLLGELIENFIPANSVMMSDKDKEGITPVTKHLIQEKWRAYRNHQWTKYKHLKEKVKIEIAHAKVLWAKKLQRTSNGLWKLVKATNGSKIKDPLSKLIFAEDGGIESLKQDLYLSLSSKFGSTPLPAQTTIGCETDKNWSLDITQYDVHKLLTKIKISKSPGHDNVPCKIYRSLADYIALPLTMIFQNSVNSGKVPSDWKRGVIIPIPKSNPPSKERLRFITLLPLPLKLLERIILRSMWKYFEAAYGPEQHGFRQGASTTTALLRLTDSVAKTMNDSSQFGVAVASYDMTCAFDNVDCSLAIKKMHEAGFPGGLVRWISHYLSNRSAVIKIKGQISNTLTIGRGVPQGSVLGPPIFCVYVRNITATDPEITTVKYADDINLIIPLRTPNERDIQRTIDCQTKHIGRLCSDCRLTLNVEKSKVLFTTRRPICFEIPPMLPVCKNLKILGVIVNENLKWNAHIDYICKKAAQRLHLLRKLKPLITEADLHTVYVTLIRSLLEYASPVFVGIAKHLSKRLDRIDKRAHRIIRNPFLNVCGCSSTTLCDRRLAAAVRLYQDIESKPHVLTQYLPPRLPTSKHISIPYASSNRYYNSFIPFIARHINLQLCRK